MKRLVVGFWCLAAMSGVGCAVGSAADLSDNASAIVNSDAGAAPETNDTNDTDGANLTVDGGTEAGANVDDAAVAADTGTKDAGTKDAGIHDAGTDGSIVIPDAAPSDGAVGTCAFTGALVTFDLASIVGSEPSLAASTTAAGVTATSLTRAGVTIVSSSGAMNASNWPSGAADASKYYTFSVTPPAACKMTLTSLAIDLKASNTGPASAAIGTSVDGYGALKNVTVTTTGGSTTVPLAGVTNGNDAIQIRVFGFDADGTAGTMRIEKSVSLSGSLGPL